MIVRLASESRVRTNICQVLLTNNSIEVFSNVEKSAKTEKLRKNLFVVRLILSKFAWKELQ